MKQKSIETQLLELNAKAYLAFANSSNGIDEKVAINLTFYPVSNTNIIQAWLSAFDNSTCINNMLVKQLFTGNSLQVVISKMDQFLDAKLDSIASKKISNDREFYFEDYGFGD